MNNNKQHFQKHNSTSNAFVKDAAWKAGDILVQKELAETLKQIQRLGMKGFYEGKTAELLVAEMKKGNGIMTLED